LINSSRYGLTASIFTSD